MKFKVQYQCGYMDFCEIWDAESEQEIIDKINDGDSILLSINKL